MSWRSILVIFLVLGAVISGWAVWKNRSPQTTIAASDQKPDYVLHDFELTTLDNQGRESFTMRAPKLERHPGDKTMTLATPLFLLPTGEGQHWQVEAKSGWISADQQEIRLNGDVKANSPTDDLRPITLNTDQLNVFPKQNRANTDALVTIVQPGSILRGRGFAVSTTTKRFELRSEVNLRYAPRR